MKFHIRNFNGLILLIAVSLLIVSCKTENGAELYTNNCATCHGTDLNGGNGTSLVDGVWQYGAEDNYIFRNIKFGIPHLGMPSFQASLSDDEIKAIVKHIRKNEKSGGSKAAKEVREFETLDYKVHEEVFAENLEIPWAIDFLDDNTAIITERPGRVRIVKDGVLLPDSVKNTPPVIHAGQGGMLDVAVDPDYAENGWIYLAYSHLADDIKGEKRTPAMTRIVRGKIIDNTWTSQEVLFEAPHELYRETRHHYGCRIVFDKKGYLFFAIGERGTGEHAQDVTRPNGKVHRIYPDGRIPDDNPFLDVPNAIPSLYSLGNRNIQGMAIHPVTDELWATEHGPMGGDELNLIEKGKNYGWPEITYGLNYNGTVITEFTHKPGMEQPILYWRPSIAVCGLDFYRGDLFPKWKNKLLVGALKYEEVRLLDIEDHRVMHDEIIFKGQGRVRDVTTGPDGAIYVVLNNPGKIVRLTPMN